MMKQIFLRALVILNFITVTAICRSQELYLAGGGHSAAILVGTNASPVEKYAAQELERTLQLMTGAELLIHSSDRSLKGAQVIIGTPATHPLIAGLAKALKLDGSSGEQIAVVRKDNTLYLAGKTPRAALYATYTFLQDVLGARWLWPGDSGEFIPKRTTVAIGQVNIIDSPHLKIRSLAITGVPTGDAETDTWMARNKLNFVSSSAGHDPDGDTIRVRRQKGFMIRVAGHNIVLPKETLDAHPEYLAEIAGKRTPHPRGASHLCWSNPNLQDEVAKMVGGWWDQSPYPDVIHFYPADQTQYCTCSNCKAMGDISTRWQKFSAILIEKLNKTHPGKKYWTYAYLEYKQVPKTEPAPFEFIAYTLYDGSYRHLLSAGHPYNKLVTEEIDGWLGKNVNLGVRGYEYIIFKTPMYTPMVSWVVDEMHWIHRKKMTGYLSELPAYGMPRDAPPEKTYWNCSRMALYASTKAMWNTDVKAGDIVKDWCTTVYGPAADEMISCYQQLEKAWMTNAKKISVFTNAPVSHVDSFLDRKLFDQLYDHFSKARQKVASLQDTATRNRIEEQISLEKKMLDNWLAIYNLKHGPSNRFKNMHVDSSKRIVLFDAGADSGPLSVEMQLAGWEVAIESKSASSLKELAAVQPTVMLVRYEKDAMIPELKEYVERGGLLIVAANGEIPINLWFPATPAVKWVPGRAGTVRKSAYVLSGSWQSQPHLITDMLNRGVTPQSGYLPLSEGWEDLAGIQTANGEKASYLLAKKLGKGMIVLTSSPMSYGGGFEMLGNRNPQNVVRLIQNLQAAVQTQKQ